MPVAALLAVGGAFYYAKDLIAKAGFSDAIHLIQNDDRNYWCGTAANGQEFQSKDGEWFCAIHMPMYVAEKGVGG